MNDENKFWISIWRTAGATLCLVVATIAGCSMYDTHITQQLIDSGKDPMQVRCALSFNTDSVRAALCMAATMKEQK